MSERPVFRNAEGVDLFDPEGARAAITKALQGRPSGSTGPSSDSLDAAWQEAEAALPEGWALNSLARIGDGWHALALGRNVARECDMGTIHREFEKASCLADTPSAALRALASALRSTGDKE